MNLPHTPKLQIEKDQHTLIVTLNNPKANTFDEENLVAIRELVESANQEKDIYAIVITGAGDKFFSAGADLKLFADGDKARAQKMARLFGLAFETLANFRGVTIAAINGYAMGGGLECALACDIRIAEEKAVMALPEAKVGLLPCAGGTQRLTHTVGESMAKRMILCGEQLDARKAKEARLVDEVVANGESLKKAIELSHKVAQQSPVSVTFCKNLIHKAKEMPLNQAFIHERELFVDLFDTRDQKEGVNAFLEKRTAKWENR